MPGSSVNLGGLLGLLLVISDQYLIRRLLTIFYYICRCALVRVADVGGWIRWLIAGGHVYDVMLFLGYGIMHVYVF